MLFDWGGGVEAVLLCESDPGGGPQDQLVSPGGATGCQKCKKLKSYLKRPSLSFTIEMLLSAGVIGEVASLTSRIMAGNYLTMPTS